MPTLKDIDAIKGYKGKVKAMKKMVAATSPEIETNRSNLTKMTATLNKDFKLVEANIEDSGDLYESLIS